MSPSGLEATFLAHRAQLVRFLAARGAGDGAEDLVQDLWLNLARRTDGPVANPLAYLYRAANLLMIDRYRARRQAEARDRAWTDATEAGEAAAVPGPEREVAARQETALVAATLRQLGPRREAVFRLARIEQVPQREIAARLGISISTVESDLRSAAAALLRLREGLR